jgi:hypothetical protein
MKVAIPGIVEPVVPALQAGVVPSGVPRVFWAQGAAWGIGVAAPSCSSGKAATQPPRAANNGIRMAARGKREDRRVAGMQRGPFGIGAGPALMLPDTAGAGETRPRRFSAKAHFGSLRASS